MRIILTLVLVAMVAGLGCDRKSSGNEDPLKKIAQQRYAEGRRLFLTCDPNNFPAAAKAFEDALSSYEDYPEALASWSETVSMWYGFQIPQDVFEQAYVRAQRAIRLAPESDMGYRAMADLFRHYRDPESGKFASEEALKTIERALALAPDSAENLYVKGSILLGTNPTEASLVLEQALRQNPDLPKTYFNLASAYQMLGDQIVYGDPDPNSTIQDARLAQAGDFYARAIKNLEIYQRLVPGDLGGYTSMGVIYLHSQRYEEAEKILQKAVSVNINPDVSQIQWRGLAYVYLAQIADESHKDLKLSRSYLERALDANPYDSQIYQQLIRIAEIQKDPEGAKKYEERYQEMLAKARAEAGVQEGGTADAQAGSTAASGSTVVPGATAPSPVPGPDSVGGSTAP